MSGEGKQPAGSPTARGPAFLAVAKIRRPHGVHGEMLVEIYTDYPERLQPGKKVFIGTENKPLRIATRRLHNQGLLLGFEGITTPEEAGRHRNQIISIPASDAQQLHQGEYYFHDLIGLQVTDESGKSLGTLTGIMETGANDVYAVTDQAGNEILLPAIADVILDVNLNRRAMKVRLLPGLIDDELQNS